MKLTSILLPLLALSACASGGIGQVAANSADLREELMAADRAFARDARDRGIDGWIEAFAPDAARLQQLGSPAIRGLDAIRSADAPLFADPAVRLVWDPVDGGAFEDGRHGYTTGKYRLVQEAADGSSQLLGTGSYVTWWRRDADGRWRVLLDTGAPDPPAR